MTLSARISAASVEQTREMLAEAANFLRPQPTVQMTSPEFEEWSYWRGRYRRALDDSFYHDAAMMLIPEGFDYVVTHSNGGLTIYAEVGGVGDDFMNFGASAPLAIAAAAGE